jgi:hypothetical protein
MAGIYQNFGGGDFYPGIEVKPANLLYRGLRTGLF